MDWLPGTCPRMRARSASRMAVAGGATDLSPDRAAGDRRAGLRAVDAGPSAGRSGLLPAAVEFLARCIWREHGHRLGGCGYPCAGRIRGRIRGTGAAHCTACGLSYRLCHVPLCRDLRRHCGPRPCGQCCPSQCRQPWRVCRPEPWEQDMFLPGLIHQINIVIGAALAKSRIASDIYHVFHLWSGRIPGGLTLGTSGFAVTLSAMTGSCAASAVTAGLLTLFSASSPLRPGAAIQKTKPRGGDDHHDQDRQKHQSVPPHQGDEWRTDHHAGAERRDRADRRGVERRGAASPISTAGASTQPGLRRRTRNVAGLWARCCTSPSRSRVVPDPRHA